MNILSSTKKIALAFFAIGTILLLSYLTLRIEGIITIGYLYVYISALINLFILAMLLLALIAKNNKVEILKSIGILLLNIPIAYLYFIIFLEFI